MRMITMIVFNIKSTHADVSVVEDQMMEQMWNIRQKQD